MRIVHLYPFAPVGRHGGTLRLAAAVAASERLGDARIHWFDPASGTWRGPEDPDALERIAARASEPGADRRSLKRRLFPSTLWESGIPARRALAAHRGRLELEPDSLAVLHTTYLAAAAPRLPLAADRVAIDVYDCVALAHRNDAAHASPPLRAARRAYAATVGARERRALARAGGLLVAGFADHELLHRRLPRARWVPTAAPVEALPPPPDQTPLRVGLLGNFAHRPTAAAAEAVLGSALARDPGVRVVLGGIGSEAWFGGEPRAEVLGPLPRTEDFYARVACVVAPVLGGSGIQVKLAEAILTGRPVITTKLGAAGFSPQLRRHFHLCDPAELGLDRVRAAVAAFDPVAARAAFEPMVGWDAVVDRYAEALGELGERR